MRSLRLPELTPIQSSKHPPTIVVTPPPTLTRVPYPMWHTMSPEFQRSGWATQKLFFLPTMPVSMAAFFLLKNKQTKKP